MQNYPLDPYQHQLVNAKNLSSSVYLTGAANSGKTTALISKIYRAYQEGKKTIVFIKDENQLLNLSEAINSSYLSPFCGILESKHRFDVEQIARLRTYERNEKSEENNSRNLELIYDFQHLQESINQQYKLLGKPFFGQMNWSELVRQYLIAKAVCPDHIIDARLIETEFEFSKNEYWLIKGRIEKAAEQFTTDFLHREKLFKDDVFLALDHPEKLDSTLEVLLDFEAEIKIITAELKSFFKRKIEELEINLSTEVDQIISLFSSLMRNINLYFSKEEQFAKEMKLFGFGQKYRAENKLSLQTIQGQLNDLRSLIEKSEWLNIQATEIPQILSDDILQNPIFEVLENLKIERSKSIDKELKQLVRRMNLQNQEDQEIEKFEAEIDSLIRKINQSRLFEQRFEMHALNIHAKYIQLNQINGSVQKAIAYLQHDKAYFSWMHLWVNLPEKTKKIIHQLHDLSPQKWIKAFDRWYLYHLLKMRSPDHTLINESSLLNYNESKHDYEKAYFQSDLDDFISGVQDEIKKFKTQSAKAYKALFKKQAESLDYKDLMENNLHFLAAVFPCLIVHTELFDKININNEFPFDQVIYHHVQPAEIPTKLFKAETTYIHLSSVANDIPGQASAVNTMITYPNEWVALQEKSPGKVLKLAQYFAQCICSLRSDFVCYLTKNETFISMLPDIYNRQLMYEYEKLGIKQFWTDQNLVDQLTECFLRKDQSKKLLLLDGLISLKYHNLMDWQFQLIKQLKESGVSIQHIWSTEMFKDNSKLLFSNQSRPVENFI